MNWRRRLSASSPRAFLREDAESREDAKRPKLAGRLLLSLSRPGAFAQLSELDRAFHAVFALDLTGVFDRQVLALCIDLDGKFDVRAFNSSGQRAFSKLNFVGSRVGFSFFLEFKCL